MANSGAAGVGPGWRYARAWRRSSRGSRRRSVRVRRTRMPQMAVNIAGAGLALMAQNAVRSSTLRHEGTGNRAMLNTGYNGLLGLLILIGDVWAIINIFQSSASNEKKLLWTVVVLLLPLLGLILWFFLGPRGGRT